MSIGLHVKYRLFCPDFNETRILSDNFRKKKYSNTKFHENPSSEGRVLPWGRTLTVALRCLANEPKDSSVRRCNITKQTNMTRWHSYTTTDAFLLWYCLTQFSFNVVHTALVLCCRHTMFAQYVRYDRIRRKGEVCTKFWWGNLRKRDHWGDQDVDERIILRWIFRKWDVGTWTGTSWLWIGAGGGRLWVR